MSQTQAPQTKGPSIRTIRWLHHLAVTVPVYVLLLVLFLILDIELEVHHNEWLARIVLLVLPIFLTIQLIRQIVYRAGTSMIRWSTSEFTTDPLTNQFVECRPRIHASEPPSGHVVLLIHGFTRSAMDWDELGAAFEKVSLDYYAPTTLGFAAIRPDLLLSVSHEDWFRQVLELYDLLRSRYARISVVGHSMGGLLGCFLANQREIDQLVLCAPALFPDRTRSFTSAAARSRYFWRAASWLLPMFPKPAYAASSGSSASDRSGRYFQYVMVPTQSMFAMLRAQRMIELDQLNARRISLIHGEHDQTVDCQAISQELTRHGVSHDLQSIPGGDHDLFPGPGGALAREAVLKIFNEENENAPD